MESLPPELGLKIFCLLDYQHLATAEQVCRSWKALATEDVLWRNLFVKRWGEDQANFFSPCSPKTWKMTYETQDRCDRVGLGLTVTSEGNDYYIVYQGEIQVWLGSKQTLCKRKEADLEITNGAHNFSNSVTTEVRDISTPTTGPCPGLLDKILFFVGDLESAARQAKQIRRS
eukprot:TRINITY_DN17828_c0_g1_i1.p1 TRINITY_DN17828_c0_g1~~TRINITY_DN17828_c0_g1_i1.p1  ORF type:complete len:173 (+),score=23.38 TRINITY_DN17828_c0_g1_i1:70-588(+)